MMRIRARCLSFILAKRFPGIGSKIRRKKFLSGNGHSAGVRKGSTSFRRRLFWPRNRKRTKGHASSCFLDQDFRSIRRRELSELLGELPRSQRFRPRFDPAGGSKRGPVRNGALRGPLQFSLVCHTRSAGIGIDAPPHQGFRQADRGGLAVLYTRLKRTPQIVTWIPSTLSPRLVAAASTRLWSGATISIAPRPSPRPSAS